MTTNTERSTVSRRSCAAASAVGLAGLIAAGLALWPTPALGADSDTVARLYRESYRLEAQRNIGGAQAKMMRVRKVAGQSYFATLRSAWLEVLAGNYPAAVAGYQAARRLQPRSIEARLGLTSALLAAQRWQELASACRDVLRLDAKNPLARSRLAHAYYNLGNYPDAASEYRRLIADYPAELDYQTGLGWTLLKMGRRQAARSVFGRVLAVSPDNRYARAGLAAR